MDQIEELKKICRLVRYDILTATTKAGSGHPTSSLSAVELLVALLFGGFFRQNDHLIFSKGHAAPLLYALYHAAGLISYDELLTLRTFNSRLEGHPTPRFPYVEAATGSLGQGLSIGLGMALGSNLNQAGVSEAGVPTARTSGAISEGNPKQAPRIWVLLGDSEMAEGQIWEAMEIASFYKLNNLIAILDVNRLGQRGETMLGWDLETYAKRIKSFGWTPFIIDDGHDLEKIIKVLKSCEDQDIKTLSQPICLIAKTIKGKGVSFLENKEGWHGKALDKEQLKQALKELAPIDLSIRGKTNLPRYQKSNIKNQKNISKIKNLNLTSQVFDLGSKYSTREAYGDALCQLGTENENVVVLDAEVSNSTYAEKFKKKFPERFFEMFIAEQNMVSAALGLEKQGFVPFASTFAAFLTRAFDQVRMSQYSFGDNDLSPNIKLCGSHCGVSIGADGPSQMGLEDIALFRSLLKSVVFSPADATASFKLTQIMAENPGLFYLRTTREKLPVIYPPEEEFKIGGSKLLRNPPNSKALVIAAGITVHEALKAADKLAKEGTAITVLDLYSIKPIDLATIIRIIETVKNIIVVEDHYPAGGIAEAVLSELSKFNNLASHINFIHLCVKKLPRSGSMEELLAYEEIDAQAIIHAANSFNKS
jgi:transketolase